MNEIASRYGDALYSLALDKNVIFNYQREVKEIIQIIKDNPDFITLLDSAFIELTKKHELIDETFAGISDDILCFIKIIVSNSRAKYLLDILYGFNSSCNRYRNVDEGFIYSTISLNQKTLSQITEKISTLEGHEVELRNLIDTSLIGGVKVIVHDHVYDGSIKSRLNNLRFDLLKKEGN
ncbi:MAG: F0F1 ATP synthase subunit delta [Bacilli bacterium]|nr:F0F1 ATP synthase subunit delta [Bacilli bacterium]